MKLKDATKDNQFQQPANGKHQCTQSIMDRTVKAGEFRFQNVFTNQHRPIKRHYIHQKTISCKRKVDDQQQNIRQYRTVVYSPLFEQPVAQAMFL